MNERTVIHATLVTERVYPASPARVFAAWANPAMKAQWFTTGDDRYELDFRVGGRETCRGTEPNGQSFDYVAQFYDIVAPQRIVYSYDMLLDDVRISVSLATIEFIAEDAGTRLICTEQGAFLDGRERPSQREGGIGSLLDQLRDVVMAMGSA